MRDDTLVIFTYRRNGHLNMIVEPASTVTFQNDGKDFVLEIGATWKFDSSEVFPVYLEVAGIVLLDRRAEDLCNGFE